MTPFANIVFLRQYWPHTY